MFNRTADQLAGILVEEARTCINNFNKFGITTSNYLIDKTDGPINSPLKYITYQKENICKFAVQYYGDVWKVIKNKSPLVCKVSVTNNGLSLKYVDNQTNELCEIAVPQNGLALEYVKNKTDKICRLSVNKVLMLLNTLIRIVLILKNYVK